MLWRLINQPVSQSIGYPIRVHLVLWELCCGCWLACLADLLRCRELALSHLLSLPISCRQCSSFFWFGWIDSHALWEREEQNSQQEHRLLTTALAHLGHLLSDSFTSLPWPCLLHASCHLPFTVASSTVDCQLISPRLLPHLPARCCL